MGIFSRKTKAVDDQPAFARTILRRALVFRNWYEGIIVIQVEVAGENFIKFNILDRESNTGDNWVEVQTETIGAALEEMDKLLQSPAYINSLFEEAESSRIDFEKVQSWTEKYGFSDFLDTYTFDEVMQMSRGETDFPKDDETDALSLGNFLVDQLRDPMYAPTSLEEVTFFWTYLNEPSMQIGLFGSYKHILKTLTDRFDFVVDDGDAEVISAFAGCLGSGYGQIEAYLSKGPLSPRDFIARHNPELMTLRYLPEFGGNAYPSLKTAQYLSRLGLRLFKKIEQECDSLTQTRFRVNLLNIADLFDQRSVRFSEYQLLVNYLIFGDSQLNTREKSGRKLLKAEKVEQDNFVLSDDFVENLTDEEIEIFSNWIPSISANNPLVANFAFDLSEKLKVDFVWSKNAFKALGGSVSERIQRAIVREITSDPKQFFNLAVVDQARFLRLLAPTTIATIFAIPNYSLGYLANQWAKDCSNRALSSDDIEISKALLSGQRGRIYADTLFAFIVNLAKYTQLEPFDEWKTLISFKYQRVYWLTTSDLLRYVGADQSTPGVFDQLKSPSPDLLEFYAKEIAQHFEWHSQEQINQGLSAILQAKSPNLRKVGRIIIRKRLLREERIKGLLDFIKDPNLHLALLADLIQEGDELTILQQFVDLGAESERVFWRKNSQELEALLQSWPKFPKFLWANLEKLPEFVRESLLNYEWLSLKLLALITPGSVAKLSQTQADVFIELLKKNKSALDNDSLVRAVLSAPNAKVNEFGAQHLKQTKRYPEFWLVMLESNLPVSTHAAYNYLESQIKELTFADSLLMALDSNNKNARALALKLLKENATPKLLEQLVHKLMESKNSDVWSVVRQNLNIVKQQSALKVFTRRVFLSRRQARSEKEKIKQQLSRVVTSISDSVESEILLRMSFSSVAKDREWALKQIALGHVSADDVIVEKSWRGPANV